jgi:hypothetical protein
MKRVRIIQASALNGAGGRNPGFRGGKSHSADSNSVFAFLMHGLRAAIRIQLILVSPTIDSHGKW